jgi:hypothetical protein
MALMSPKKRSIRSEGEIDTLVVQQAEDDDAWEPAIIVPASGAPRPSWMRGGHHLELAAKFYVLSVLHRLGAEANLTFEQPDNVDITVVRESGQALTVDVKMLRGTKLWPVEHLRAREHHFVVFVCFPESDQRPEVTPDVYAVHSEQLKRLLNESRTNTLNVDSIPKASGNRDAWRQLAPESAA